MCEIAELVAVFCCCAAAVVRLVQTSPAALTCLTSVSVKGLSRVPKFPELYGKSVGIVVIVALD